MDAIVAATNELSNATGGPYSKNGYVYTFHSTSSQKLTDNPKQLIPGGFETSQKCGNLGLASGMMVSANSNETIFASAYRRDLATSGDDVGAVDVYNFASSTPASPVFVLTPPLLNGTIDSTQYFGYMIEVADINQDGCMDVIIAAQGANRVYIFWGQATNTYGISGDNNNNLITVIEGPTQTGGALNGVFGSSIAVVNVDGNDALPDLLVGDPHYSAGSGRGLEGKVYLYKGATLAYNPNMPNQTQKVKILPVGPDQTFACPAPADGTTNNSTFQFGFYLWMADVNGDGLADLLIHGEGATWPGTNNGGTALGTNASATAETGVGVLYIYYNQGTAITAASFASSPDRQLYSPKPQIAVRFSKNLIVTKWKNLDNLDAQNNPIEEDAIILSEPETDYIYSPAGHPVTVPKAGTIMLYFCSAISALSPGSVVSLKPSWQKYNTYMDFSTLPASTHGPQEDELFGRWMVTGNFGGNAGSARQFLVTSSGRPCPDPHVSTSALTGAGASAQFKQN
ncbi:MAG: VCBS repeat-containing protein [Planctomycetes bacterium]|nr:VCBS repeat-containing protein [Planctomycetota bacterium]